ncbi:MAG: copper amine oxidase N-terminal domain-containing protein [Clostridiales bacterium]|nr:copper amine oxidase N-terminal domain-containing protein [Clostridiales bacterium]
MKKLISLLMAAVLLFNVPVYAASYASLNKVRTIRDDVEPSDQYLTITPLDEVSTGSSIIISFTNAKVVSQTQIDAVYQYDRYNWKGSSEGFWTVMTQIKTNELPYKIRRVGLREIQVDLINLPGRFADGSLYTVNGVSKRPVYKIRLPFISDGEGTIQIKINNNESTISSATLSGYYIWTKGSSSAGVDGLTNTEGSDGEIISEITTEATTTAASSSSSGSAEAETETTTETPNIFDLNYNDYIAVRDLEDILENSLFEEKDETDTEDETEAVTEETSEDEEIEAAEAGEAEASEDETEAVEAAEEEEKAEEEEEPEINLNVKWDASTKTATINYNGTEVQFISYSDYYVVNGENIYFEGGLGSVIIDGKMYVPAGLIIDVLGLKEPGTEEEEEEIYEDIEINEYISEELL